MQNEYGMLESPVQSADNTPVGSPQCGAIHSPSPVPSLASLHHSAHHGTFSRVSSDSSPIQRHYNKVVGKTLDSAAAFAARLRSLSQSSSTTLCVHRRLLWKILNVWALITREGNRYDVSTTRVVYGVTLSPATRELGWSRLI
eukprot:3939386-Rhodomonas_salina.1